LRRICVVVASRANYGRVRSLLSAIENAPGLSLQLIFGASLLLEKYGNAAEQVEADGFTADKRLFYILEGGTLETQAKSTGLGIIELSSAFAELKPHAVVTVADRYETLATAIAASYMNIPLVHIQGGETSGNIDDRVRNAITKLADIHFVATEQSKKRVIEMGEDPKYVFNTGCPSIDLLASQNIEVDEDQLAEIKGTGHQIDWRAPYILMVQHPVTTSYGDGFGQTQETLKALRKCNNYQKVVLWPNIDAGTDDVSKALRVFKEDADGEGFSYFRNFSPLLYNMILANAACAVGNSSSFIREGSFLGTPAVLVGDRQISRETGKNVLTASYQAEDIFKKIMRQVMTPERVSEKIFGAGNAGIKMSELLTSLNPLKSKL